MKFFGKELKFNNNKVYHSGDKPTPNEIGAAASSHTHNYAGSSSAGGAANSANTLATARTINGTSFNGSANITTANWGTARTFTIGNKGKSVNGSGNVSWSLAEIGAANISDSSVVTTSVWSSSKTQTEINTSYNTLRKLLEDVENNMAYYNHTHSEYLNINGGTVNGYTYMKQGFVVHAAAAGGGTNGYLKVATIKISGNYQNESLFFKIGQRGRDVYDLELRFANTDHTDPGIDFFKKDRENVYAYIHKSAAGVWDLYIHKSESYDRVDIFDYKKGTHMSSTTVTWKDELVSGVPSGYIEATMKNIPSSRFTVPGAGNYWNNGVPLVGTNGVMEIGKYLDFHNTNATTSDYSTRLMCTGDTKNEVQLPSGSGTIGLMRHANDYWGLVPPDGNGDNWIRTTTSGLIPHQSGVASNIGTESWRFANGYFGYLDASGMIRARDRFEVANIDGTAQFGVGGSDSFWYNKKANKYVQFKNNGTLCISDSEFYHRGHNIIDAADRSSGDSGFGNSSKPCGFIGRFPGWNSNCLYINTWSNGGAESASYGIVKIKGSQVQHDGFITIQGTPVSVQSSAPGVGGVWIQI